MGTSQGESTGYQRRTIMHRRACWIASTLLSFLLGATVPTRADLIVTIGNESIPQGGDGFVDVMIRSDNPAGDLLTGFGFEFVVTGSGPRTLQFVDPQPDSQLTSPDYVFFGNSADLNGGDPVGQVSSSGGGTSNRFVGGDDTEDASDVTVTVDRLLARLHLTSALGTRPIAGDVFTITLERSAFTSFDSNAGSIGYSSVAGQVTITGTANPVPEPATLILALLTVVLVVPVRRCLVQ
jgi:hypothetical protein